MPCRRIEEAVTRRLIGKFPVHTDQDGTVSDKACASEPDTSPSVEPTSDGAEVVVGFDGSTYRLSRSEAAGLRDALADALTRRREFLRTAGEHREDGTYVVERRAADSAGHRKVFEGFESLERLYARLPMEFRADDVGRSGLTGGRRHMLVRHFVEHPAFDCELVSRQPLTAEKVESDDTTSPRSREAGEGLDLEGVAVGD